MIADFPRPGEAPIGGPQVAVSRLVPRLVAEGIEVVVVAPDPTAVSVTEWPLDDGGTLVTVPSGRRWTLPRELRTWRRNAANALRRHSVELAHGQGLLPGGI